MRVHVSLAVTRDRRGEERLTRTVGVVALVLPVTAVTDAVTDQLRVDADVGVALESLRTAECL